MFHHWSTYVLKQQDGVNPYLRRKLRNIASEGYTGALCDKWIETDDEDYALWMEAYVIDFIGIENLCNLAEGGIGGRKPNSGRKKLDTAQLSTRVRADTLRRLRDEAKRREIGLGKLIDELADQLLDS